MLRRGWSAFIHRFDADCTVVSDTWDDLKNDTLSSQRYHQLRQKDSDGTERQDKHNVKTAHTLTISSGVLALANHIYCISSIGYLVADSAGTFINERSEEGAIIDSNVRWTASLLLLFLSLISLFGSVLYYYCLQLDRNWVGPLRFTNEVVGEIMNMLGCLCYLFSSLLWMPLSTLFFANAIAALNIDRIANALDTTGVVFFLLSSILYMNAWRRHRAIVCTPSPFNMNRFRGLLPALKNAVNTLNDPEMLSNLFNVLGSLSYMVATIFGVIIRADVNIHQSTLEWVKTLRVEERHQQLVQFVGDCFYIISSIYTEKAFYDVFKSLRDTSTLLDSDLSSSIISGDIENSATDSLQRLRSKVFEPQLK